MWTQRDQLQAYQFLRRRVVSALLLGDANHPVSPTRRVVIGTALGVVLALVVTAGFWIVGLLRPGANQNWRQPGQVIIEKETGATHVLGQDGRLHPVVNYASARLLAGGNGRATVTVSAKSLARVARGRPVGIPGAPDSLPAGTSLLARPWTVCSANARDQPAAAPPTSTALLGAAPAVPNFGSGDALVVRDNTGTRYVLVDGRRMRLADQATAVALGYDQPAMAVASAWLNVLPAGQDLGLIAVPGSGRAGPRVGSVNTLVGQILVVETVGTAERYYLVRPDGLRAVSQTEAALILGSPANRAAYPGSPPRAIRVSPGEVGQVRQVPADPSAPVYPARVPRRVAIPITTVLCAVSNGDGQVILRITGTLPLPGGGQTVPAGVGQDTRVADQAFVPPGRGALVQERQAAEVDLGTVYLITDQGIRFPIASQEAVKALGYADVRPVPVAPSLLALFRPGPTLDPAAAAQPVAAG